MPKTLVLCLTLAFVVPTLAFVAGCGSEDGPNESATIDHACIFEVKRSDSCNGGSSNTWKQDCMWASSPTDCTERTQDDTSEIAGCLWFTSYRNVESRLGTCSDFEDPPPSSCSASLTDQTCSACMEGSCCSEMEACLPGTGCGDLSSCIENYCGSETTADGLEACLLASCSAEIERGATDYNAFYDCRNSHCSSECG